MLRAVYKRTVRNCPFCMSIKFSLVKLEKVVNPPQKPTMSSKRKSPLIKSLLVLIPAKNPMIKLPTILTVNVPIGIASTCHDRFNFETKKRKTLPANPPKPTSKISFIRLFSPQRLLYFFLYQIIISLRRVAGY